MIPYFWVEAIGSCHFDSFTIDSDTSVGTDNATRGTADAIVRSGRHNVRIAVGIDFSLSQSDDILRTGNHAQRTALATVHVNDNGSNVFLHN